MDLRLKQDKRLMILVEDIMKNYNATRDTILHLFISRLGVTDTDCLVNLQMDRNAFGRLCKLFAILILAIGAYSFRYVHEVIEAVIKMHSLFVVKPEPIKDNFLTGDGSIFRVDLVHLMTPL
ncbi:hypothetical protein AAHA92_00990 [Salvia divinorum]|uniref:Uncharacterized protein n=1 Tax=Salvia divinorum TaxID=28513 RepID=A0ABD1ILX7_SALDI